MARSMWSGVISFGLVTIPVRLLTATESHAFAFHQLHEKCETRIKEQRWCPHCERKVEWSQIVKGYEYKKGKYIVLTDEDFEKLPLPSKHTIELASFVDHDEIDPLYYESSYYLDIDQKGAQKPYKLLAQVMEEESMVGIATITFRNKEKICAIRASGGKLILHTLHYKDEIRTNETVKPTIAVSAQEKKMAQSLIKSLSASFKPEEFKDNYQQALNKLIKPKLKGKDVEVSKPNEPTGGNDLMAMLQASLAGARGDVKRAAAPIQDEEAKSSSKKKASKPSKKAASQRDKKGSTATSKRKSSSSRRKRAA